MVLVIGGLGRGKSAHDGFGPACAISEHVVDGDDVILLVLVVCVSLVYVCVFEPLLVLIDRSVVVHQLTMVLASS